MKFCFTKIIIFYNSFLHQADKYDFWSDRYGLDEWVRPIKTSVLSARTELASLWKPILSQESKTHFLCVSKTWFTLAQKEPNIREGFMADHYDDSWRVIIDGIRRKRGIFNRSKFSVKLFMHIVDFFAKLNQLLN